MNGNRTSNETACNLVVIPAFNEQDALPQTIARLQSLPDGYELLVIDDGSTDDTWRVLRTLPLTRLPLHAVRLPFNCGIGVAVQTGYRFAQASGKYRYVIQFDADGQHDAEAIQQLVDASESQGFDLCVGSRFESGSLGYRSTWQRRIGIRFFAFLIGSLSGARITDPTSGFRCAGPRAWQSFAENYPEDFPEPESLYWCLRNRLRVGGIAVRMFQRQGGVSSIGAWKAAYYMFKVTAAILVEVLRRKEPY